VLNERITLLQIVV